MACFFSTYPYAFGSLLLLAVCGAGLAVCPRRHRWAMLLSALISAPYAFMSVVFVPKYWDPVRVFEIAAGPEDVVFSFANGGTVWLLSIWLVRDRVRVAPRLGRIVLTCVACTGPGLILTLLLSAHGMPVMTAAILTILLAGGVLLGLRGELWPLPLAGTATFTAIYCVVLWAVVTTWPHILAQWNTEDLWGISVLRIPLEELVFAAVYGAVWPLQMAVAFDARLLPHKATGPEMAGECTVTASELAQAGGQ